MIYTTLIKAVFMAALFHRIHLSSIDTQCYNTITFNDQKDDQHELY